MSRIFGNLQTIFVSSFSDDDNDLDKPRLRVELYLPPVLEPVDVQVEVGVRHGVAAEGGRVASLHLVRLRALVMVKYFY